MKKIINYSVFAVLLGLADVCSGQENQFTLMQEGAPDAPVVVYGSANEGQGARNTVVLEQNGDENPLGNPIPTVPSDDTKNASLEEVQLPQQQNNTPLKKMTEILPQNPKISAEESPQQVNKQIQNTLYESGGRIYDIQSYPASDIKYIEEPNINPTITTYPAY